MEPKAFLFHYFNLQKKTSLSIPKFLHRNILVLVTLVNMLRMDFFSNIKDAEFNGYNGLSTLYQQAILEVGDYSKMNK